MNAVLERQMTDANHAPAPRRAFTCRRPLPVQAGVVMGAEVQ